MPKYKLFLSILLICSIILIFYLGIKSNFSIEALQKLLSGIGIAAPIIFILIYTIAPVFFLPITPLSMTSGILFGPFWGTIIALIGANFGATATFLVSKYLLKDWLDKKSSQKVNFVQNKVKEQGWKFVSISRLIPIFPFNLQNYLFGITDIQLKTFFLASILGLIPGTFAYTYLGYLGKNAVYGDKNATIKIIIPISIIAFISLIPYIMRRFQKKVY